MLFPVKREQLKKLNVKRNRGFKEEKMKKKVSKPMNKRFSYNSHFQEKKKPKPNQTVRKQYCKLLMKGG